MQFLYAVLVMGICGGLCGLALGIANDKLAVVVDTRIEDVHQLLPGYNCGGCGHPGCEAFATALVEGKETHVSKCRPSKPDQKAAIVAYFEEYAKKYNIESKVEL